MNLVIFCKRIRFIIVFELEKLHVLPFEKMSSVTLNKLLFIKVSERLKTTGINTEAHNAAGDI